MKSPLDRRLGKETSSASPAVSPARSDALRILLRYRKDGRLLNSSCEQPENRRLADQIAFGTVQNGRFLDAVLDSHVRTGVRELQCAVREILRMSAFQILFLDRVPDSAAVNDAVSLCRQQKCSFAAGFVNAVLRNLSRGKDRIAIREPAVRYSHPDWVYSRLVRDFGESFTEAFLSANQVRPDLRLQLNTQRCSADVYLALLKEKGIAVLDDAARAAVRICSLAPGMRVLDACAAPGGKSMAAALDGAEVTACDISEKRLARCCENFSRMQMNIAVCLQDAAVFRPDWEGRFDCVLADVPCTGTGIIRRHPEIREKKEEELFSLLPIQQAILNNLSRYVKPGGLLLYSTCSVLREEDEDQVCDFLGRHADYSPDTSSAASELCKEGIMRSWPQQNGNDGFFAAKLRKQP